jgi:hypothetical protein
MGHPHGVGTDQGGREQCRHADGSDESFDVSQHFQELQLERLLRLGSCRFGRVVKQVIYLGSNTPHRLWGIRQDEKKIIAAADGMIRVFHVLPIENDSLG